ncbi:nucleoid-associated protein [Mucilaginibacter dorajii]|uniref:Nucleoid-associated protein n=1 Tax=Mucilaginibacter dorajii TaxID=692994 RepID=A0ABP7R8B4_9SPHI|nr:nucleoid-associated protein [Mucilaginibacter dorajii]MCS3737697.1 hypothetical protein [Mucilaginibacter dorajii]
MPKESVLSEEEKSSFEIKKFIFHIIIEDQLQPIYLDEVALEEDQIRFFTQRLVDVSEGVQHVFVDREKSEFVKDCETLIADPEANFLRMSKKLAYSFKSYHSGQTSNGVFIAALVNVESKRDLIFLLKLDNRKVYQYRLKGTKALLKELTQTFVEDKKAVQKSALVDVSDYYSWDVLARERNPPPKQALRVYFSNFLTVMEKDVPSTLTPKAVKSVRAWAISNREDLDPDQDVSSYRARAIGYMMGAAMYKTDDFIDAVVMDENEERRERLRQSLKEYFDEVGMSGQSFVPNKTSLKTAERKNIRETAEGVKIEWEGEAADNNIDLPREKNPHDGLFHIVIKTREIINADKS